MSPRRAKPSSKKQPTEDASASWRIHFFQRHRDDDRARTVPAREFLDRCPTGVAADIVATVKAVAEAPPPQFAGGGQWQAMHGSMKGFHEVRATGPGRRRYRLFCILERDALGLGGPSVVLITGMDKPPRSGFSEADYGRVRALGREFLSRTPRSVAR